MLYNKHTISTYVNDLHVDGSDLHKSYVEDSSFW